MFEIKPPTANAKATDWINYGNELWRLFRHQEAIAAFDSAIALQPDIAQAHYGKGISLIAKAEFEEIGNLEQLDAEEEEELIEIDRPTYEEALAAFAKTTELDPNFETAWREQARLLKELGKYPEALAAYDKAIALNPDNDRLHYFRGSLLLQLFRYSEAADAFSKAIAIKPNGLYYMIRGSSYALMGDFQKFNADLERAKEINPEQFGNLPDLENLPDLKNSPNLENIE